MIDAIQGVMAGDVVVSIGQLSLAELRTLNRLAKNGRIAKWRGHWFPIDGHPTYGMGPLKTCYALVNPFAEVAS